MRQPLSPSSRSEATTTEAADCSAGTCTDDVALRTCRPAGAARSCARSGRPLEDVQGMLARIAQRPQFAWRRDDRVQRRDRQIGGDPPGRGRDPGADITAVDVGLLGDQREYRSESVSPSTRLA